MVPSEGAVFSGLEWSDSFELGVERLDEQHRDMLGLAASFERSLRGGAPAAELGLVVDRLRDAFTEHFGDEERMMRQVGARIHPSEVEAHLASHLGLLQDIEAIGRAIADGGNALASWIGLDVAASLVAEIALHDGHLIAALARAGCLRASRIDLHPGQ